VNAWVSALGSGKDWNVINKGGGKCFLKRKGRLKEKPIATEREGAGGREGVIMRILGCKKRGFKERTPILLVTKEMPTEKVKKKDLMVTLEAPWGK